MVAHAARSSAVVALAVSCLFLCVADCSAQASPKGSPACSRERSRHARAVLDEFFHPVVDKNRFELPPACPFARAKDMYLEHERHKEVVRRTQYKSLYSDKTFKSEYYVDKHMDNRHSDKIPAGADVCLAEYCDVLRCDAFRGWRATDAKARFEHALDAIGLHAHECDEAEMEGARARCERVVARCFPSREAGVSADAGVSAADAAAARLRAYFSKQHCGFLTCGGVEEMFHEMAGHRPSENKHKRVFVWLVVLALAAYYAAVASRRRIRAEDLARRRRRRGLGVVGEEAEKIVASLLARFGVKRRKRKKQM